MRGGRDWCADTAQSIIDGYAGQRGALLPLLHALQHAFGYIDDAAIPLVAAALNLSRADVYGVVSFYEDFRSVRPGRHIVRVCRAEACRAVGAGPLARHAEAALGVAFGDTRDDGVVTLEAVSCLGNCGLGPSVEIDGRLNGHVDAAEFDLLMAETQIGVVA